MGSNVVVAWIFPHGQQLQLCTAERLAQFDELIVSHHLGFSVVDGKVPFTAKRPLAPEEASLRRAVFANPTCESCEYDCDNQEGAEEVERLWVVDEHDRGDRKCPQQQYSAWRMPQ